MISEDILKRVPPQNIEAEQSILGAVLLDNAALDEVLDRLKPEQFYRESHRRIYEHMVALSERRVPIDAITLCDVLRTAGELEAVGGAGYVAELAACVPSASTIGHYARIVREKALLRGIGSTSIRIANEAYDGPIDVPEFSDRAMRDFCEVATSNVEHRVVWGLELAREGLKRVETANQNKSRITGIKTGFPTLDLLTGGLQRKDLIVIAARPSLGKSALGLRIAANAARDGVVVFFSFEMSREQLELRLLACESLIEYERLAAGYLKDGDLTSLENAHERIAASMLGVDDSSDLSVLDIKAILRRISRERGGLDLVVVDYMQLVRPAAPNKFSREQEVAGISRALKALAKDLDVPVLALSQLNRQVETRGDRKPRLSDLRESGAIEQDADVIAFLWAEENEDSEDKPTSEDKKSETNAVRWLLVRKQRNGKKGNIKLVWRGDIMRFDPCAEDTAPPEGATVH